MVEPPLSNLGIPCIVFVGALAVRALFSFLETSITALRLFKLKELASEMRHYSAFFKILEKTPQRILITILIANCLADVTSAALATHIAETIFARLDLSGGLGFSVGIGIATLALLTFGEIIPKNFAKGHGERHLGSILWLANFLLYAFYPLVTLLMNFSDFLVHRVDTTGSNGAEWVASEKEIQFLIDHIKDKGLIETEKTEMLQNIFDLGVTPVREILVPAVDIVSIDVDSSLQESLKLFLEHRYSRFPVFENTPDNIIGMIYFKDVFPIAAHNPEHKKLRDVMRPILMVPESMKVNQLLREFRQQHMHIAMVVNEYGSITGLITLEDVLEEIVGEISDEHEMAVEDIIELKQGGWLVKGHTSLDDLRDTLSISFEGSTSLTLGGFMTEQLQHLPKKGERFMYQTYYFQVQKATPKRVLQVLIMRTKPSSRSFSSFDEEHST